MILWMCFPLWQKSLLKSDPHLDFSICPSSYFSKCNLSAAVSLPKPFELRHCLHDKLHQSKWNALLGNITVDHLSVCRKVELSLSWKLTFVLIKASMLVPDQFNWQVWCLCFVRSLSRPLCTDLPLWFDVLVSKSRWSAPAANDLARCQKLLFLSHYFTVLCEQLMTILSLYYFLCCLFESKHVCRLFVRDNRAVMVMFLSFSLGKHEIQPDLWFLSYRCDSNIWFFFLKKGRSLNISVILLMFDIRPPQTNVT